jgi:hypothetical protein
MEGARERHSDALLDAKRAVVADVDVDPCRVEREAVSPRGGGCRERGARRENE